jgi:hypothetical protein
MRIGPKGENCQADAIGNAIKEARAEGITPERRAEIEKKAATKWWENN